MRFAMLLVAMLLWVQPAGAVTIFAISGSAPGIYSGAVACPAGICPFSTPYVEVFSFNVDDGLFTVANEIYTFSRGQSSLSGIYSGTFRSVGNGEFEGLSLSYFQLQPGCFGGPNTCVREAFTNSFSVRQTSPPPVPEPATWALMLLGFAAIGAGMRRRHDCALASTKSPNAPPLPRKPG